MTKDEALKLALEALEAAKHGNCDHTWFGETITAIKETLAPMSTTCEVQPEQEPLTDEQLEQRIGYRLPAYGFDAIRQLIKENT